MSQLEVDKIIPQSGTTLTIGDSGDTVNFADGTNLSIDTNTLYIDSTNNRVGIANNLPSVALDVTGAAKVSGDLTVDTDTLRVISSTDNVEINGYLTVNGTGVDINTTVYPNAIAMADSRAISFGTDADFELSHSLSGDDILKLNLKASDNHFAINNGLTELVRFTGSGNVGIGTSSPTSELTLGTNSTIEMLGGSSVLKFTREDTTTIAGNPLGAIEFAHTDTDDAGVASKIIGEGDGPSGEGRIAFYTGTPSTLTEVVRIDSSGQVGIGTSSPEFPLDIQSDGNGDAIQLIGRVSDNVSQITFTSNNKGTDYFDIQGSDSEIDFQGRGSIPMIFKTNLSEAMRIDSSGNVLVGKTTISGAFNTVGTELRANGLVQSTVDGSKCIDLNRKTSDGDIIGFSKDGTTAGSIGAEGNALYLGTGDTGIRFAAGSDAFHPFNPSTLADRDDAIDIGLAGIRFDDIYATNGTIQTSDQNEKNTITDSDLGLDFVNRLTPKSYIFNGKTRTHYGLIAQEVETVLSDISKTSTDFAGFIKSDISEEQDGSEYRYGLRYNEFIAPMIKAIQELKADNDALRTRIETLENA